MKKILYAVTALFMTASAALAWGENRENSDVEVMRKMDRLLAEGNRQVPLPGITNFFEKRMVKMLYELRDNPEYRTYTYIVTMNGTFIKMCDSIGMGINASIQFSNPVRPTDLTETAKRDFAGYQLDQAPQAEPNGLFMPEGLSATYAMCLNPADGELAPIYVEPNMVVSPFPYKAIDARTGEVVTD